ASSSPTSRTWWPSSGATWKRRPSRRRRPPMPPKPFGTTTVSPERTKDQIRAEVARWGGEGWRIGEDMDSLTAFIEFRMHKPGGEGNVPPGRWLRIRMYLPLPDPEDLRQVNRGAIG